MKYELGAVIPTVQYGNLQPKVELEGEDFAELTKTAESYIQEIWDRYGDKPLKSNTADAGYEGQVIETFTGEKVVYYAQGNDHYYTDMEGNRLESGSAYAARISPKFDRAAILPKTAKAWGVPEDALGAIWDAAGEVSTGYGSSVHKAIETYLLYGNIGETIQIQKELEHNYVLPKNPILRQNVLDFLDLATDLGAETIYPEAMVSDVKNKRAGQIDLLTYNEKRKALKVRDFKTNNEIDKKKMLQYQHQLSFYAHVLMAHGHNVEGLVVYHLENGEEWKQHDLEVLDLSV